MEDVNTAHFLWRVVGALVVLFLVKKVVDWLREPALQILPPRLDSPPVVARTPPSAAPRPLAVSEPRVAMRPPSSPAPTPATPSSEAVRLRKQRLIETARAQFLLKAAHS